MKKNMNWKSNNFQENYENLNDQKYKHQREKLKQFL